MMNIVVTCCMIIFLFANAYICVESFSDKTYKYRWINITAVILLGVALLFKFWR